MMTPSAQQNIVMPLIKDFMKSKGYKYSAPYEKEFSKPIESGIIRISVFFSKHGRSSNSLFRISYKAVESIIVHKVGLPNNNLERHKTEENILFTMKDSSIFNPYSGVSKIGDKQNNLLKIIETEKDALEFANFFKEYVLNEGDAFIKKYSHLPNALEKIDELEYNNDKFYSSYICGGTDKLFRVLLISKLCNDPNYNKKKEKIDARFDDPRKETWKPYYARLCDELERIVPIY